MTASSKSQRKVKKKTGEGGSNKYSKQEKQEDNQALEKKGTDAHDIKIILRVNPDLKMGFSPFISFV